MMDPQAIARRAYRDRDTRSPLTTIYAALGLDRHPRIHRDGVGPVNRLSACLNAWKELAAAEGLLVRDSTPPVWMDCEWCGVRFPCEKRQAHSRRFCSHACARRDYVDQRREERHERNRGIVAAIEGGESPEDVAARVGLSVRYVEDLYREWSQREEAA